MLLSAVRRPVKKPSIFILSSQETSLPCKALLNELTKLFNCSKLRPLKNLLVKPKEEIC